MTRRCAIYTRKSTDEGLDQAFNSLDAQRDACAAFTNSQKHEGWRVSTERYDDGGHSGGTMERPALQRLLDDVRAQKVDVVVVYKIDRLTRSLTDFARIVEIFDANQVSFVSVTQQFNTTSSMGRLTLNVLLSFAQFEREVTAERIRDKIAASKKKGMWMGGVVPLGYDARNKKLVINESEAQTIRTLFALYLELGSVRALKDEADRRGIVTKRHMQDNGNARGGRPFSRGHLYRLLANPLYLGKIQHRGTLYDGEHDAIVDDETWHAVQTMLATNASVRTHKTNGASAGLLTGLLFDDTGDRLSPSHAVKEGRRYRYYISHRLKRQPANRDGGYRLPAERLERAIVAGIDNCLSNMTRLIELLGLEKLSADDATKLQMVTTRVRETLQNGTREEVRGQLAMLVHRIDIDERHITVHCDRAALITTMLGSRVAPTENGHDAVLALPFLFKRRGFEGRVVIGDENAEADRYLVGTLAQAQQMLTMLSQGETQSLRALADQANMHAADVGRLLPLAFLAPDIVEAILSGRQPVELTAKRLKRVGDLPVHWEEQRRILGFAAH